MSDGDDHVPSFRLPPSFHLPNLHPISFFAGLVNAASTNASTGAACRRIGRTSHPEPPRPYLPQTINATIPPVRCNNPQIWLTGQCNNQSGKSVMSDYAPNISEAMPGILPCAAGDLCRADPRYADVSNSIHRCLNCSACVHCVLLCGVDWNECAPVLSRSYLSKDFQESL